MLNDWCKSVLIYKHHAANMLTIPKTKQYSVTPIAQTSNAWQINTNDHSDTTERLSAGSLSITSWYFLSTSTAWYVKSKHS